MADNSFAWAASKGLLRTNEVHKTEEAKLVIEEKFVNRTETGSKKSMTATGEVEAPISNESPRIILSTTISIVWKVTLYISYMFYMNSQSNPACS